MSRHALYPVLSTILVLSTAGCATPPGGDVAASTPPAAPICHDYTAQAVIDGTLQPIVGRACREGDGTVRVTEGPPGKPPVWTAIYPATEPVAQAFYPGWWGAGWWGAPVGFGFSDFVFLHHGRHHFHGEMHGFHHEGMHRHG